MPTLLGCYENKNPFPFCKLSGSLGCGSIFLRGFSRHSLTTFLALLGRIVVESWRIAGPGLLGLSSEKIDDRIHDRAAQHGLRVPAPDITN